MIHTVVTHLDKAHFFMPPWCGTEAEATVLTEYLQSLSEPTPEGMRFSNINSKENSLAEKIVGGEAEK